MTPPIQGDGGRLLDRAEAISRGRDDSDFGELCEIIDELSPLLREWADVHDEWSYAVASAELAGRVLPVQIIGFYSDKLREVDKALADALRSASQAVLPGSRPAGEEGR